MRSSALCLQSAVTVRPRRPVSQDVLDVRKALEDVTTEINVLRSRIATLDTDIDAFRTMKEEGWQTEVAALRRKEEQLREEKKQLQEKELLLLKRDAAEQP